MDHRLSLLAVLIFIPIAWMVFGAGRYFGGADVEDEDVVFVDLGVVESDGVREVDFVFDGQAVAADHLCAAAV